MQGSADTEKSSKQLEIEAREARLANIRRLLAANFTDKEIANKLGIGLNRARKDVAFIREELGFTSRRDAARHLAELERVHDAPGRSHALPQPIANAASIAQAGQLGQSSWAMDGGSGYVMSRQSPDIGVPLRLNGAARNELSWWQRAVWIVLIACVTCCAIGFMSIVLLTIR